VAGQPVPLEFTVVNHGGPAHLLTWNTPLEGWFAAYVDVSRDGQPLPYQGPMFKRGDPTPQNYVHLAAGEAHKAQVDLALPFDFSVPGRYRVVPHITVFDLIPESKGKPPRPRDAHQSVALSCNTVEIEVSGR
jgi:hypothetical protein